MIIKYSGFKKYTSIIGSYIKSKLWDKSTILSSIASQIIQMKFQSFIYKLLIVKMGLNPVVVGIILIIL